MSSSVDTAWLVAVGGSFLAGNVSSLLGVGGGIVTVPLVHLVMGTSYYKLRAPGRVVVERPVTKAQAAVAEAAYTHGLGEFAAVNRLPVPHEVAFDL